MPSALKSFKREPMTEQEIYDEMDRLDGQGDFASAERMRQLRELLGQIRNSAIPQAPQIQSPLNMFQLPLMPIQVMG